MSKEKPTMAKRRRSLVIVVALLAFWVLAAPLPAFSQSCALCYTQAASAGGRMIQALKSGILILIVPATLGSVGMIFVLHSRRNQVKRNDDDDSAQDW